MVKWIGKFSLLLKRLRDAWMDLLPASSTAEQVTAREKLFPLNDNLSMVSVAQPVRYELVRSKRVSSSLLRSVCVQFHSLLE